ncbi:hypothetical protein ACF0H5_011481 [Mactra antiquata]
MKQRQCLVSEGHDLKAQFTTVKNMLWSYTYSACHTIQGYIHWDEYTQQITLRFLPDSGS